MSEAKRRENEKSKIPVSFGRGSDSEIGLKRPMARLRARDNAPVCGHATTHTASLTGSRGGAWRSNAETPTRAPAWRHFARGARKGTAKTTTTMTRARLWPCLRHNIGDDDGGMALAVIPPR